MPCDGGEEVEEGGSRVQTVLGAAATTTACAHANAVVGIDSDGAGGGVRVVGISVGEEDGEEPVCERGGGHHGAGG